MLILVLVVIFVALAFDFLNGFHDAANSIATVVSTRVLTPRKAVAWAAFFNFVAAFVFNVHIAKTMGNGLIDLKVVNEYVILCGLVGAIAWNLLTWWFGIPSSSSHALRISNRQKLRLTRNIRSTSLSSATATSLLTLPRSVPPNLRGRRTTRCSFTAVSVSEKRI